MRNKHGHTPQEQARAEVLDLLEALSNADEDRNPDVKNPSFTSRQNASEYAFDRAKRKHFARLYYKLADEWDIEPVVTPLKI